MTRNVIVLGTALAAVAVAAALAFVLLWRPAPDRSDSSIESQASGDFAWLENAMKQCDTEAAEQPKSLHFLVSPMVDEPKDEFGWRRISINDIGNAILISGEDALAGLRRKALRLSDESYVFSIRNEKTREVLAWKASVGVRKFVTKDDGAITSFKAQFQSSDPARATNWGATFERKPGNCYWVNAILRT